ncbi:ribbon-helix-helix protein, CopG family [bacterium CPR1]|nr:ribbon-helix-helix protein, CopG family [bacterium CPR1]
MHRTQIYLPQEAYESLVELSQRQGITLAESIRRAVQIYLRQTHADALSQALETSFGAWGGRSEATEDLVKNMRQEWSERELRGRYNHSD